RASGVPYDVRRVRPYLDYDQVDFEVPVQTDGDVYARYKQRIEEIRQSIRIIEQLIDDLPDGPVNVTGNKVMLPPKERVYGSMEELIHHFELVMPGYGVRPPVGETYVANEVPTGEQGYYLVSDGSGIPYRVRIRPPSFYNLQAMPHMLKGAMVSDVVAVLSSLHIIAGELDR
ncbi:MAG: NADH-quinone oxidoreductase subunit D, partial [Planctomycetota bacterium]